MTNAPSDTAQAQAQPDNGRLIALQILLLANRINAQGRAALARHDGPSLPEWRIIRVIGMGAAAIATDVSRTTGIDKGQFSRTLAALVAAGLVAQEPCPEDRRRVLLRLTPEGRALHDRLAPVLQARQRRLAEAIPEAERDRFFELIGRLMEAADDLTFLDVESPNTP